MPRTEAHMRGPQQNSVQSLFLFGQYKVSKMIKLTGFPIFKHSEISNKNWFSHPPGTLGHLAMSCFISIIIFFFFKDFILFLFLPKAPQYIVVYSSVWVLLVVACGTLPQRRPRGQPPLASLLSITRSSNSCPVLCSPHHWFPTTSFFTHVADLAGTCRHLWLRSRSRCAGLGKVPPLGAGLTRRC